MHFRNVVLYTGVLLFQYIGAYAQQDILPEGKSTIKREGKIELIQDPRVPLLIEKHIQLNNVLPGVADGYRIQIYFDSGAESKKRALDVRNDFTNRFPGIPAYLSFQEPFFKVRIGDYRIKLEADGMLLKILTFYPNAYVVRDRINYPHLGMINNEE